MNQKSFFFTLVLLFTLGLTSIAQPISGIVNHYARVMSFDSCDMSFVVTDATNFHVNTRILLIQMNGATTQSGNNASFGAVTALNNVGKYEVNIIDSVSNQVIFFALLFKKSI